MRAFAVTALVGSFLFATGARAQSLAEHAAAASGATIGTAAGKPLSNAITKVFGQTDATTKKAASASSGTKTPAKPPVESAPVVPVAPQSGGTETPSVGGGATPARHGGYSHRPAPEQYLSVRPIANPAAISDVEEPARKEPTAEELAGVQVGASEKELVAALGEPASKVTIPDEGHLVEICQYWAKGRQIGSVRLDNGQVVNVNRVEN
jgi:hypothetical protein